MFHLCVTEGHISILIEELDGGEYLFAIRMLMVLFRREFSFVDAMYLWEVQTPIIHSNDSLNFTFFTGHI